ncbi:MAG: caspase family protein [Oculatellaceae cyanobacterium bins.114]|nr:caspase family protein [Oculatellaceae cyanobacterium bins.114]
MTTYWAIAIGINQYRCFQPLMYAQRDAQALWSYWASEGHFPPEQCLLLTDASVTIDQSTHEPDRDTIENTIDFVCQQLQPDDVFWCFFSGYGVRFQGRDYLMPIDGDPRQVPITGIPIESLFATLRTAPSKNIVLVLDINRSQGVLDGEGVGHEAIALANQFGIPLLLSCPPHQFSHETLALRQGLFTAALLEGLRFQGCATMGQLAHYVSDRLPELSEHHCRPRQDSVAIVPAAKQHLLLVPEQALVMAGVAYSANPSPTQTQGGVPREGVLDYKTYPNGSGGGTAPILNTPYPNGNGLGNGNSNPSGAPVTLDPVAETSPSDETDTLFWKRWRPWVIGAIALLILAVLLQNRNTLSNDPLPEPSPTSSVVPSPSATTSDTTNPALPNGSNLTAQTFNPPGTPSDPVAPTENPDSNQIDASPQPDPMTAEGVAPAPEGVTIPPDPVATIAPTQNTALQQTNQALLLQARASLSRPRALSATNQASDFSTAIQIASRIKPGEPFYPEAQQDIDRWSQIILELAKSRASQPNQGSALIAAQNYSAAIRAAGLVPASRTQLHATAQQYMAQWSQGMMNLANARAREGRLDVAIRTAQLVPNNAPSYTAATQAIAEWRAQLGYYQ